MTRDDFTLWLAKQVYDLAQPGAAALPTPEEANALIAHMLAELLADPMVPWPSDLPGPKWR